MFSIFNVEINILAILLASAVNIFVGIVWYSPMLFGNTWMKLVNKKKEDLVMTSKDMIFSVLSALFLASGINSILQYSQALSGLNEWVNVLVLTVMVSVTLIGTSMFNSVIYEGKPLKLFFLNLGHQFATVLLVTATLNLFV